MAVFYKWIKGFDSTATLTDSQWTYLSWGSGMTSSTGTEGNPVNVGMLPTLQIAYGKSDDDSKINLGYLLSSQTPTPLIKTDFLTNHAWYFFDASYSTENTISSNDRRGWIQQIIDNNNESNTGFFIAAENGQSQGGGSLSNPLILKASTVLVRNASEDVCKVEGSEFVTLKQLRAEGKIQVDNTDDKSINTSGGIYSTKTIETASTCHAKMFNATSDIRSKENIQTAKYNALDLINKLPVYVYNYKGNNETVTGIMAQDLLNAQPKELDLVSNINATGIDGDYMSIKNDKFMFVLMKAIQEQQKEIEELKK